LQGRKKAGYCRIQIAGEERGYSRIQIAGEERGYRRIQIAGEERGNSRIQIAGEERGYGRFNTFWKKPDKTEENLGQIDSRHFSDSTYCNIQ
jgi:hypothetical protein